MQALPEMTDPAERGQAEDELSLNEIIQSLRRHLRLIVAGALAVGVAALGVSFLIPNTYMSRAVILLPQQTGGGAAALAQLGALAGVAASAAGIKSPVDQYVGILKSTTIADRLVARFDLLQVYQAQFVQDARSQLADATLIQAGKDGLIRIEVTDRSPQRAADMANAYFEELDRVMESLALSEARQRRVFFEQQLKESHERLVQAQAALQATGVAAETVKLNPQSALEAVARLRAQIMAQEIRLAGMRGYLNDQSAELRQAQRELVALRGQLTQIESSAPVSGKAQDQSYLSRYRDFKYYETLFEMFARQFELAKADEARDGMVLQVVDRATPAERKAAPRRGLIAILATLATALALALGGVLRDSMRAARGLPVPVGVLQHTRTEASLRP